MEIIKVAEEIEQRVKLLSSMKERLRERTEKKAKAVAEYDKQLALTIIKLKNGKKYEFEGEEIENPPATIIEKIARGICWKEKLEADKAETSYKSLITGIDCLKTEINGYQSIFRYLDER